MKSTRDLSQLTLQMSIQGELDSLDQVVFEVIMTSFEVRSQGSACRSIGPRKMTTDLGRIALLFDKVLTLLPSLI